ncbi:MAG: hypothetical protein OIF47_17125 [Marinibacterium sp.]|nr:hypothetical protein [Marinibacterium sp.]
MALADTPTRPLRWQRFLFAVPFFGWVARDVTFGTREDLWYAIALFVMLWVLSVVLFGVPGLYIPAVLMVPVMFVILILISQG